MVGSTSYASVLEEAGLARAKLAISTLRIEESNNLLAYRCKQAGVPVAIHAFDPSVVDELLELGVDYLIDPRRSWLEQVITRLKENGVAAS
jgi:Trk K+ transport system NAD-binding subunit